VNKYKIIKNCPLPPKKTAPKKTKWDYILDELKVDDMIPKMTNKDYLSLRTAGKKKGFKFGRRKVNKTTFNAHCVGKTKDNKNGPGRKKATRQK